MHHKSAVFVKFKIKHLNNLEVKNINHQQIKKTKLWKKKSKIKQRLEKVSIYTAKNVGLTLDKLVPKNCH